MTTSKIGSFHEAMRNIRVLFFPTLFPGFSTMFKTLLPLSLLLCSFSSLAAPSFVPLVAYVERDGAPLNATLPIQVMLHEEGASGGSSVSSDVEVTVVDGLLVVELLIDSNALVQIGDNPVFEIILDEENMGEIPVGEVLFARNAAHAESATTSDLATSAATADEVNWQNVTGIPAGFLDGNDANTLFTAGTSLTLAGNTFSVSSSGITATQIATNAVGADEIAANAVGASELADNSVDSSAIQNSSVTANHLATNSVGYVEIGTDAVRQDEIQAGAVGSSEIAASAVDSSEIATGAVTNNKMDLAIASGTTTGDYHRSSNSDVESCGAAVATQFCGLTYYACVGTGNCSCRIVKATNTWQLCAKGDTSPTGIATCRMSCF